MLIHYTLGKATNGKFRWWSIECDENYAEGIGYSIIRKYGQVGGKETEGPCILVAHGKAKRTTREQLLLQINSELKKQLDKGYIEVPKHPNEYSSKELDSLFGSSVTNQFGIIKPMLAKQESKLTKRSILDKEWMVSRKLDGVRCLMYWDGTQICTASRGGETYDYSTTHIRKNPDLIEFFQNFPTVILDGELYRHDKILQQISGAARLEQNAYDCEWLQYWIYDGYDTAHPELTAEERNALVYENVPAYVYHNNDNNDGCLDKDINYEQETILLLNQVTVSGETEIWKLHDQYVSEGFEGCVIRDPNRSYKPNGRTNDMIKFKRYLSDDFKVISYELGLRGSEDMVFVCELDDGRTFKAMPVGNREVKEEYVQNFEKKYNGHKAECTYFNLSDDGIPTQPKLRIFRFDLE